MVANPALENGAVDGSVFVGQTRQASLTICALNSQYYRCVLSCLQEVAETFLRCVKERFAEDNVVIELNALKIAEDRSFADCARYILTTLLALCLPAPAWVSPEYVSLFASDVPDTTAKDGKLLLLSKFKKQMTKWQALLKRFLNSEDDQVWSMTHCCHAHGVVALLGHATGVLQPCGSQHAISMSYSKNKFSQQQQAERGRETVLVGR